MVSSIVDWSANTCTTTNTIRKRAVQADVLDANATVELQLHTSSLSGESFSLSETQLKQHIVKSATKNVYFMILFKVDTDASMDVYLSRDAQPSVTEYERHQLVSASHPYVLLSPNMVDGRDYYMGVKHGGKRPKYLSHS